MKDIYMAASLAWLGAFVGHSAVAQEVGKTDEDQPLSKSELLELDEVTVVGSRMKMGDSSARVEVITAEEISRRGLATAEDIIRSIPQNVSSFNSVTSGGRGVYGPDSGKAKRGYSAANLRGLGSSSTLVLVNGRRIVSASSDDDFTANLRDIPAAAIERVEISFDSASAVYGSDAVGGVINIILKKGFTGAQLGGRYETSNTGADLWRVNSYVGNSWGTGSASATVSYQQSEPISNRKTGWVTRDYRDRFGPDADFRRQEQYRSGTVWLPDPETGETRAWILPPGHNGVGTSPDDFVPFDPYGNEDALDYIDRDASEHTKDSSVAFNVEQELFEGFKVSGDVLYSDSRSNSQSLFFSGTRFQIPASNAFNPFGEDVEVGYFPIDEIRSGAIPGPSEAARTKQLRYGARIDYRLTDGLTWVTDLTRSTSRESRHSVLLYAPSTDTDPRKDGVDPQAAQRLRDILALSNPGATINVFGDGTAQTSVIRDFILTADLPGGKSTSTEAQSYITAKAFDLPAGAIGLVAGGSWRREQIESPAALTTGIPDPSRDSWAAFTELSIPVFSDRNARPLLKELTLTAQARYDRYDLEGAVGTTTEDDPYGEGDPLLRKVSFDAISPRLGVAWSPLDGLLLRSSYSTGFKAPGMFDLFDTVKFSDPDIAVLDPLTGEHVTARSSTSPNPDLQPERSHNWNIGLDYSPAWLPGLAVRSDYSRVRFNNLIVSDGELANLLPPEVYGNIAEIFVRDATGRLIEHRSTSVNIGQRVRESFDSDIAYYLGTAWGDFEPGVNIAYVIQQYDQVAPGVAGASLVGTTKGVDRYKLQVRLNWRKENLGADLYVNHAPGYRNNAHEAPGSQEIERRNLPARALSVDSYTTVDLTMNYTFGNGFTVRAGARNLFDADPPFCLCDDGLPYDPVRVDLRGRVAFMEVSYDFSSVLGK